jgi:hypothetical protein
MTDLVFQPTEDVSYILNVLHEAELAWIAQEVEDIIQAGKIAQQEREIESKSGRWDTIEVPVVSPYTATEQIDIVKETLCNYIVGGYDMWRQTQSMLTESLGDAEVSIAIAEISGEFLSVMFDDEFQTTRYELDDLLYKLGLQQG